MSTDLFGKTCALLSVVLQVELICQGASAVVPRTRIQQRTFLEYVCTFSRTETSKLSVSSDDVYYCILSMYSTRMYVCIYVEYCFYRNECISTVLYVLIRGRCTVSYIACKATVLRTVRNGAPLLELSSYPFSKYMKSVADADLASYPLHKSRKEIWKMRWWCNKNTDETRK